MEPTEECSVCVAVKIRPLVASEHDQGCHECLSVAPGAPVVRTTGSHEFTYDYVFGGEGTEPELLYPKCVAPLVEGLFKGYNATVFAYGQTGSGKTFTMGSEYRPGGRAHGVIPEAIGAIFARIAVVKDYECSVRVSFVEIHKEEIKDLLASNAAARAAVSIREGTGGGVSLYGATEKEVRSVDEMAGILELGTLCRATASTHMNSKSSRSHAIYTITVEQRRQATAPVPAPGPAGDDEDEGEEDAAAMGEGEEQLDDYLCAKMHLVDLAGSERAKRTKAEGARLKEGIHINRGLLALGNVINAIVDNHKHVPYRDSKLTRLLQDSLGGNSRTVMIACVSPADVNFEEGLNTLRYADRARHIRNKPTVNRDPVAAQVAALRQQLARAQAEIATLKRSAVSQGKDPLAEPADEGQWQMVEQLQQENSTLEMENARLKVQLETMHKELSDTAGKLYGVRAELDLLKLATQGQQVPQHPQQQQQAGPHHPAGDAQLRASSDDVHALGDRDAAAASTSGAKAAHAQTVGQGPESAHGMELLRTYVAKIADLEKEVRSLRSLQQLGSYRRRVSGDQSGGGAAGLMSPGPLMGPQPGGMTPEAWRDGAVVTLTPLPALPEGHGGDGDEDGDVNVDEQCFYAEMAAHALEQEKMKQDMAVLQRVLELKEFKMNELMKNSGQVPALKQHYDRVLQELEKERDLLQSEKVAIMQKLQAIHSASEEERKRLEAHYKERIAQYDERLKEVRRKEREFITMQKLKLRTDELCNRLNSDIARIKQQKVALMKNMESSAKQFAVWRANREKELVQLRRQNRRNVVHIQHLEALQAKQNAVLQRKICDATAARKKLKELQSGKEAGRSVTGSSLTSLPSATTTAGSLQVEVQPNAQAPLLRNERSRREWLEKELDMCNQSYEYQRVLDGELAQRAETSRHLREMEKRLMLLENLVPASPLLGADGSAAAALMPVGGDSKERLLQRKEALQKELAEHNAQIVDLQAAWEQAKVEEEGKGGGAADAKRWTGVRGIVESRELLRTLFKVACDHKAQAKDVQMDLTRMQEEMDVMRVQLDAARQEAEAQRKRAAAVEATAATALATPFAADAAAHDDEMDADVDDLLQQLQVVAATPGSHHTSVGGGSRHGGKPQPPPSTADVTRLHEAAGLDGTVQVREEEGRAQVQIQGPGQQQGQVAVPKALDFHSPIKGLWQTAPRDTSGPSRNAVGAGGRQAEQGISGGSSRQRGASTAANTSGAAAASAAPGTALAPAAVLSSHPLAQGKAADRYGGGVGLSLDTAPNGDGASVVIGSDSDTEGMEVEMEMVEVYPKSQGGADDMACDDDEDEEEGREGEGTDDDDEADEDWDPQNPTPAKARGRRGGQGWRSGSQEPETASRPGRGSISSGGGSASQSAAAEGQVLEHLNQRRAGRGLGRLERLTVKVLKDELTGKLLGGKAWRAGSKTKEQLLSDYCSLHGLSGPARAGSWERQQSGGSSSSPCWGSGSSASMQGAGDAPGLGPGAGSPPFQRQPSGAAEGGPASGAAAAAAAAAGSSAGAGAFASPMQLSPMAISPAPPLALSPRPFRSLSSFQAPSGPAPAVSPRDRDGRGERGFPAAAAAVPLSQQLLRAATVGRSQQHVSTAAASTPAAQQQVRGLLGTPLQIPDSPASDFSLGEQPREHNLTPLSLLYIQKAQEARERTAQLRQSIQKGSAGYEAAAAARASVQAVPR